MRSSELLLAIMCFCVMSSSAWAAGPAGLVAEWNYDEGQGDVLRDTSGNENHGKIHGAINTVMNGGNAVVASLIEDPLERP